MTGPPVVVELEAMVVEGFKCWGSPEVIHFKPTISAGGGGDDTTDTSRVHGFTAIIGGNGCGKSTVLDAFLFCVCAHRASEIRASSLAELLYESRGKRSSAANDGETTEGKEEETTAGVKQRANVTCIFGISSGECPGGSRFTVRREIRCVAGASRSRVDSSFWLSGPTPWSQLADDDTFTTVHDERRVHSADLPKLLQRQLGIDTMCPDDRLVIRQRASTVAAGDPLLLLKFLERLAGTDKMRDRAEELAKEANNCTTSLVEIDNRTNRLSARRAALAPKCEQIVFHRDCTIEHAKNELVAVSAELAVETLRQSILGRAFNHASATSDAKKEALKRAKTVASSADKALAEAEESAADADAAKSTVRSELSRLKARISRLTSAIDAAKTKSGKLARKRSNLKASVARLSGNRDTLESRLVDARRIFAETSSALSRLEGVVGDDEQLDSGEEEERQAVEKERRIALKHALAKLDDDKSSLLSDRGSLKSFTRLEVQCDEACKLSGSLKQRLDDPQSGLRAQCENLSSRLSDMRSKVAKARHSQESLRTRASSCTAWETVDREASCLPAILGWPRDAVQAPDPGTQLAVNTVLGTRLRTLLVATRDDAIAAADTLHGACGSSSVNLSFSVLDEVVLGSRAVPRRSPLPTLFSCLIPTEGADPRMQKFICLHTSRVLLAATADEAASAFAFAQSQKMNIVTREGSTFFANGEIRGSAGRRDNDLASFRVPLQGQHAAAGEEGDQDLATRQEDDRGSSLLRTIKNLDERIQGTAAELQRQRHDRNNATRELSRAEDRANTLQRKILSASGGSSRSEHKSALESRIQTKRAALEQASRTLQSERDSIEELASALQQQQQQCAERRGETAVSRLLTLRENVATHAQEIEHLARDHQRLATRIDDAKQRHALLRPDENDAELKSKAKTELSAALSQKTACETRISSTKKAALQGKNVLRERRKLAEEANLGLDTIQVEKRRAVSKTARVSRELQRTTAKLAQLREGQLAAEASIRSHDDDGDAFDPLQDDSLKEINALVHSPTNSGGRSGESDGGGGSNGNSDDSDDDGGKVRGDGDSLTDAEKILRRCKATSKSSAERQLRAEAEVDVSAVQESLKLAKQIERLHKEASCLRSQIRQAQTARDDCERDRFQNFISAADKVDQALKRIFNEITGGGGNGGRCELSFSRERVSLFSDGVSLLAKPEMNCAWREIWQLSGGQQALVGIALSLACQNVFPSPFVLWDECDASLDTLSCEQLGRLMKSQSSLATQFFLVSHRPELIEHAHTLMAIWSQAGTSRCTSVPFAV